MILKVTQNTLKKDIIINGVHIPAGLIGEFHTIECPVCEKKEIEK